MALASFSIDVDELGHGSIEINGVDVSDQIGEMQVRTKQGEPTIVVVRQVVGAAQLAGAGIVRELVDAPAVEDPAAVIVSWLAGLDPAVVEQVVLDQLAGLNPPSTNGEAWIRALQHLAGGS